MRVDDGYWLLLLGVAALVGCPEPIAKRCGPSLPPCAAGEVCVAEICALADDAGSTAGGRAGGAASAGGMTAGGTAGGVDGGAFDASVPDPGLDGGADSGIDAGAPDAGLAGGADAGAPDAAPRDAGLPLLDALATRAQRLCERLSECGLVAPADLATTCARPLRDAYWAFTVPQAWGHPMTDAGTRCAEIAALPCQTNLVFANLIDLINSCPMAFAPQAGLGSACVEDGDCSDPSSLC